MGREHIKIIVAAHKEYQMPRDDMYLPVCVGSEGKKGISGYVRDNSGDNISKLNPVFCELTGLYWAWKNLDADYIGLVHYRRHFRRIGHIKEKDLFNNIMTYQDIEPLLGQVNVFVPKKRRYYIETLYSHYAHTFDKEQLQITRKIISEKCPEYLPACDAVFQQRSGHMFNMMIMEQSLLNDYCEWLFSILFELYNRVDSCGMSDFERRFCGRISEIIFNIWLKYQLEQGTIRHSEIRELPYIHMEKVDWIKKGGAFLKAKFFGTKYESSM